MASFNKHKRNVAVRVFNNEPEVLSGSIALDSKTPSPIDEVTDTQVVLLIAAVTLCGAALFGAVLFMALQ